MLPFATSKSSFTRHLRLQRRPTWVLEICWWTAIPWRQLLVPWPLFLRMAWLFKFCLGVCLGSSQCPAANPPAPSWALRHFISLWSEKTTGDFSLTEYWATITICINTLLCNTPAIVDWQRGIAQGLRQDYPESQGARVFSLTRSSHWLVQTICKWRRKIGGLCHFLWRHEVLTVHRPYTLSYPIHSKKLTKWWCFARSSFAGQQRTGAALWKLWTVRARWMLTWIAVIGPQPAAQDRRYCWHMGYAAAPSC